MKAGDKFGLWVVLKQAARKWNNRRWLCRCQCGVEKDIVEQHLTKGKSTRCLKCLGKDKSERVSLKNKDKYSKAGTRTQWVRREMERRFAEQRGFCSICGKQLPQDLSKCAWDHNHSTGEGRDLLHRGCNVLLGFIERDSAILSKIIQYCEKYKIQHG